MGQFFLANQKNEKLTRQLVSHEYDQSHMDAPMVLGLDTMLNMYVPKVPKIHAKSGQNGINPSKIPDFVKS